MSKSRIKIPGPLLRSRNDMEECCGRIRALTIEVKALEAARNAALQAVDERYQPELTRLSAALGLEFKAAEAWAEANLSGFVPVKSIDMIHAVVGWRIGQPALKTLPGWTFDRVLEHLRNVPVLRCFIRTKEEVDKQGIIASREKLDEETLRGMGVRVVQEDRFFVEPKLTETQPEKA